MIKKHTSIVALAALVGLSAAGSGGCGAALGDSAVRGNMRAYDSLEDIMKSVHCLKVSTEYVPLLPSGASASAGSKKPTVRNQAGTAFAYAQNAEYTYLVTANHLIETAEVFMPDDMLTNPLA
ncbi:hypothetical protein HZB03_03605, partial [Candidatus Woesearchaeota archaeon]|nr:hypothetical protein [Candidatus Woesearchaeota archaeon]